ncbi:hypothetical protein ACB092_05G086000 [Castanea dentata]
MLSHHSQPSSLSLDHYSLKEQYSLLLSQTLALNHGRLSSDIFPTFEAPMLASEQHQLCRATTSRPTRFCQEELSEARFAGFRRGVAW